MALIEGFRPHADYIQVKDQIKKLKYQSKYALDPAKIQSLSKELEQLRSQCVNWLQPTQNLSQCAKILAVLGKIDKVSKVLQQRKDSIEADIKLSPVYINTNSVEALIENSISLRLIRAMIEKIPMLSPFQYSCEDFLIALLQGKYDHTDLDGIVELKEFPEIKRFFYQRMVNPIDFIKTNLKELKQYRAERPETIQEFVEILISIKDFKNRMAKTYLRLLEVTQDEWDKSSPQAEINVAILRRIVFANTDLSVFFRIACQHSSLKNNQDLNFEILTVEEENLLKRFIKRVDYENGIYICFQDKLKFLKLVRSLFPKCDANPILINGAGPAGLLRGLLAAYFNIPFTIVEKRSQDSSRDNIILLGHFKFDVELLEFLGVLDLANERNFIGFDSISHMRIIRIKDMEQCLRDLLQELAPGSIQYNETIKEVVRTDDQIHVQLSGSSEKFLPSLIMDCSGANSQFRGKIGIANETIGKVTRGLIAYFDHSTDHKEIVAYSKEIENALQHRKYTFNDLKYPGLLFNLNGQHYIGSSLSQGTVHALDDQLNFREFSHLAPEEKINPESRSSTDRALGEYIKETAEDTRSDIDLVMSSVSYLHKAYLSHFKAGYIINLPMRKASSPYALIGNVPCTLNGDAYSTLDPSSGRGASKAMASSKNDLLLLASMGCKKFTPTLLALWSRDVENYTSKGFAEAFKMRLVYQPGTEKAVYFLNLGCDIGALDIKTKTEIVKLLDKRGKETYSSDEKKLLLEIKLRIVEALEKDGNMGDDIKSSLNVYKDPDFRIPDNLKELYRFNAGKEYFDEKNRHLAILMGILYPIDRILMQMDKESVSLNS